MAVFPIRVFPDPVLRTESAPVEVFDDELKRLAADLIETMYDAPGVGLAAPQIGITRRIFVADVGDGSFVMVNPEIVETAGEWEFEEGCLSIPEHWWEFARPSFARAVGQDLEGDPVEYSGEDLLGRVLQHETDHLVGELVIDRLGRSARKRALAELREAMAEDRLGRS
jgi:peptide deformylase